MFGTRDYVLMIKGFEYKRKTVIFGEFRRRFHVFRGKDEVKNIPRSHHWKEHEKTSPEVLSNIFEPVQNSLKWQVKISTI